MSNPDEIPYILLYLDQFEIQICKIGEIKISTLKPQL